MQRWHNYAEYQQFLQGIIQPLLAAAEEKERQRQAELARQRAEAERERQRQAELARQHAEAERERQRQAELARQRAEEEKERQWQAKLARWRAEREKRDLIQRGTFVGCLIVSALLLTGFVSSHKYLENKFYAFAILFAVIVTFVGSLKDFLYFDTAETANLSLSVMLSLISQYLLFGNFAGFNLFVASFFLIGYSLISVFIIYLIVTYITER